jgi:hypothetical protein
LFNPDHPQGAFWLEVHGNFVDKCALEWCKLFADRKGEHHWRRVVGEHSRFEAELHAALGVTPAEFNDQITKIKHYRDKFVAHLDQERTMFLPALEVARKAIVFLHERLAQHAPGREDWQGLRISAKQLDQGFTQAYREAQSVYAQALARLAASER